MSEESATTIVEAKEKLSAEGKKGRQRLLARHEREIDQEILMHVAKERAALRPPPSVDAKPRGETDALIGMAADAYERANPGMTTRAVFAPENRRLHSGVPKARMRGYKPVRVEDLEMEHSEEVFGSPDSPVTIYDTQLMATSIDNKRARRKALDEKAVEQTDAPRRLLAERQGIERAGRTRNRQGQELGVRAVGEIKQTTSGEDFIRIPERKEE